MPHTQPGRQTDMLAWKRHGFTWVGLLNAGFFGRNRVALWRIQIGENQRDYCKKRTNALNGPRVNEWSNKLAKIARVTGQTEATCRPNLTVLCVETLFLPLIDKAKNLSPIP